MNKKYASRYLAVFTLLILVILVSLGWGTYHIEVKDILKTLIGGGTRVQTSVIMGIRLPRICVALIVGIALATAGSILQSVTRNPLAEPGIIGINAGASLAVVLLISRGTQYYNEVSEFRLYLMPAVSIVGAMISALVVYLLSSRKGKVTPVRLVLVGLGVNVGINSFVTLYQLNMSGGDYNRALTWTSGSLWGSSWKYFWIVTPFVLVLFLLALYKSKTLDVIDLGDELATGLGVKVEQNQRFFLFIAVAISALATAVAGNIAFLGLLGPHIAKSLVGPVHHRKLPMAAMISAIIIIFADTISRNLFSPIEVPVGITISLVGVPYFVYLVLKK